MCTAGGLVVKTQIEGVADTHITVEGEVVVEADGQRGEMIGTEGIVGGVGIYAAVFIQCVEGCDAHSRRHNSKRAVDVGITVLPEGGVGVARIVGKVVDKREMEVGAGGGGTGFGSLTCHLLVDRKTGQHLLCLKGSNTQ